MGICAILLDSGVSLQINGGPTSAQRCILFCHSRFDQIFAVISF